MFRGDRRGLTKVGLIVGAVLAALLVAVLVVTFGMSRDADYQRQANNNVREYAAYTEQKIGQRCLPLAGKNQAACVAERRHEQRADQRDEQDLVAQRKAANWAYIMGSAAVIGMVLSVVGVGLVWTTFRETRAANDIAKDEQRPWVDVEIVDISMSSSTQTFDLIANIRLTNLGKSPAFNVQSRARITVSRGRNEQLQSEFLPGDDYTRITHNLLPTSTGEDILFLKVEADKIPMVKVYMGTGEKQQRVAGPHFVPTLEVMVDYQWGSPLRPAKTIKKFTISEVSEHWPVGKRIAIPISLGQTPVPELTSFEHGIAEIT